MHKGRRRKNLQQTHRTGVYKKQYTLKPFVHFRAIFHGWPGSGKHCPKVSVGAFWNWPESRGDDEGYHAEISGCLRSFMGRLFLFFKLDINTLFLKARLTVSNFKMLEDGFNAAREDVLQVADLGQERTGLINAILSGCPFFKDADPNWIEQRFGLMGDDERRQYFAGWVCGFLVDSSNEAQALSRAGYKLSVHEERRAVRRKKIMPDFNAPIEEVNRSFGGR